jgi:hypothetical protein
MVTCKLECPAKVWTALREKPGLDPAGNREVPERMPVEGFQRFVATLVFPCGILDRILTTPDYRTKAARRAGSAPKTRMRAAP